MYHINILDRTEAGVPADQLRSARSSRSLALGHHYRPMNAVLAQRAARECRQVSTKRRHVAPGMEAAGSREAESIRSWRSDAESQHRSSQNRGNIMERYRLKPGRHINLKDWDAFGMYAGKTFDYSTHKFPRARMLKADFATKSLKHVTDWLVVDDIRF